MDHSVREFVSLIDIDLRLGESPVWDAERNRLWFIDSLRPALFCLNPDNRALVTYDMPAAIGSIGLTIDKKIIVALRTGVHIFDPATGEFRFLAHPEPDSAINRLNDGKVGPDGCFWVGSMHEAKPREPTGALYRITPSGECTRIATGLTVSNGLAWSPDGKTLYHANSRPSAINAYDFEPASGAAQNPRLFAAPDEETGFPDGAAVDAEGVYWSAGVTAGQLNKFSPNGDLIGSIKTPMRAPTMPCFGGADMRTLFVTSLTSADDGVAGTLVSCRVAVPGVGIHLFGA